MGVGGNRDGYLAALAQYSINPHLCIYTMASVPAGSGAARAGTRIQNAVGILPAAPNRTLNSRRIRVIRRSPLCAALPGLAWDLALSGIKIQPSKVEEHISFEAFPVAVAA